MGSILDKKLSIVIIRVKFVILMYKYIACGENILFKINDKMGCIYPIFIIPDGTFSNWRGICAVAQNVLSPTLKDVLNQKI